MVAERRVASIGRVDEGVALVESPPGFDADQFGPDRRRHLQLHGEGNLEAGGADGSIRRGVVKDRPIAVARQEDGPTTAVRRQVTGERLAKLPVRSECRRRVTTGRHQQVERVAGDDDCARAFGALERARELHRRGSGGLRSLSAQEEVAHDDHSPADGNRQTGDVDVLGHVRSIVAVGQVTGR
jgi:hypothetical protein